MEMNLEYLPENAPTEDELQAYLHSMSVHWFYTFEEWAGGVVPEEKHLTITVERVLEKKRRGLSNEEPK